MTTYKYIVVGGGLSAGYAAQEFAEQGISAGELCILSAEETLPYERPPLSKDFLAGDKTEEDILINDSDFYEENGIVLLLDSPVITVNLDEKRVYTDLDAFNYQKLLIATGSQPRTLDVPGADLDNIFYLRRISDARRIRDKARDANTAVVVGGSFIGMEAAAVLQNGGVDVTMIFPGKRVWESFFTPEMSDFFEEYYRQRGVTILSEEGVDSFEGDGSVKAVVTKSGERITADMVVCGVGVKPNSDLFTGLTLDLKDGMIKVNKYLETNVPDVFAAGDITSYQDVIFDRSMHIEHWDNAVEQGRHAARAMMGRREPFEHVPYFFSDVFDLSYEFWGDTTDAAKTIHRGSIDEGSFSTWWLTEDGRVVAAFVMDRPDEEREMAPELIRSGESVPDDWLRERIEYIE